MGKKFTRGAPGGAISILKGIYFQEKFILNILRNDARAVHYGFSKKKISENGYTESKI